MKTALVHDWLVKSGGGEKVLEEMYQVFPSKIFTLVKDEACLEEMGMKGVNAKSSFIQKLPKSLSHYRNYLPLFPLAIEQFDLTPYDLVLSSSYCVAKGVLTHSEQLHICYCHTPMRYAWDLYQDYLRKGSLKSGVKGILAKSALHYIRMWDLHATPRVDVFIANSKFIARRIKKVYQRASHVIYPPVDTEYFTLDTAKDEYYLTASRFVPYKKIDLIVEAFSRMPDKKLLVIGDGPDMEKIKKKAGINVEILGFQSKEQLKKMMQKAKAFVFAAFEDFGIIPVEAMACGTPVIAFGKGGVLETVMENRTGVFFEKQTVESIVDAVFRFESAADQFNPEVIRQHACRFNKERFNREYKEFVLKKYEEFKADRPL